MINYHTPDLTQHPPRSPRVRLGGFVHLPRLLDKARAFAAGNELYLPELRSRIRSIAFVSTGLVLATFIGGTVVSTDHRNRVIGVSNGLAQARDLRLHSRHDSHTSRVVFRSIDALTRRQTFHRLIQR